MFRRFPIWDERRPVINNNIISGPIMPSYHHCCNNGFQNSIMKWMGWGMAFNMINNMFQQPYSTGGFYPYVDLSSRDGAGGSSSALNQNSDLINCQQLYGNKYKFSKVGENYYAVSADGKRQFSASTPEELLEEMKESKGTKVSTEDDDDEVKLNIVKPEESAEEDNAEIVEDGDGTPSTKNNSVPKGWYPSLSDNNNAPKYKTIDALKQAAAKAKTTPAQMILADIIESKDGSDWTRASRERLLKAIIKNNSDVFEENGTLKADANIKKLKYPSIKWINKNIKPYKYGNVIATESHQEGSLKLSYLDYGNKIYKKGGEGGSGEAIFKVNGQEYNIRTKNSGNTGRKLTYENIIYKNNQSLINPKTGRFNNEHFTELNRNNPNAGYVLQGNGPLKNGVIIYDPATQKVVLQLNGKKYPMDDIMLGTQKV